MNDEKQIMNVFAQAYQLIAKASKQQPSKEGFLQILELLGEEGIQECAKVADLGPEVVAKTMIEIIQEKLTLKAKNGAKLRYINTLNGKCPAGYLKKGGRCKPCEQAKVNQYGGDIQKRNLGLSNPNLNNRKFNYSDKVNPDFNNYNNPGFRRLSYYPQQDQLQQLDNGFKTLPYYSLEEQQRQTMSTNNNKKDNRQYYYAQNAGTTQGFDEGGSIKQYYSASDAANNTHKLLEVKGIRGKGTENDPVRLRNVNVQGQKPKFGLLQNIADIVINPAGIKGFRGLPEAMERLVPTPGNYVRRIKDAGEYILDRIHKRSGGGDLSINDYRRSQQDLRRRAYEKAKTVLEGVPTGSNFLIRGTREYPFLLEEIVVKPLYYYYRGKNGEEWISEGENALYPELSLMYRTRNRDGSYTYYEFGPSPEYTRTITGRKTSEYDRKWNNYYNRAYKGNSKR